MDFPRFSPDVSLQPGGDFLFVFLQTETFDVCVSRVLLSVGVL